MGIRWTQPATRDLTQICDYVEQHSNAPTARQVALSIHESVGRLAMFPLQGRAGRLPNTRELVIAGLPYVVVYRTGANAVEILRILHGAMQWP